MSSQPVQAIAPPARSTRRPALSPTGPPLPPDDREGKGKATERSLVKTTWTDEELMQVDHEGKVELVNGELIRMTPAGLEQGEVDVNLILQLGNYVKPRQLGKVYDAQTGFRPYENMRAPDVAFVRLERLPGGKSPQGFGHFPPDLAVEVFAPGETVADYADKVAEYFRWGVRLVWLVDPAPQTVTVCHSPSALTTLTAGDELSGEDVVPGFTCRVGELFE
jgi:Uma2 family endonuclease